MSLGKSIRVVAALLLGGAASVADAQGDMVVMRRVIAPPMRNQTGTAPTMPVHSYDWEIVSRSDWKSTCSVTTSRDLITRCRRSDGQTSDASFCSGIARPVSEPGENLDGCTFDWVDGDFGDYSSTCSTSATRSRSVDCRRADGAPATADKCDPSSPKAKTSDGPYDISTGCTYAAGGWTSDIPSSTCSDAVTVDQTATTCIRSDNKHEVTDVCVKHGVATTRKTVVAADYSTCTYSWLAKSYGPWTNQCTASASRTVEWQCQRSGVPVADVECISNGKPRPSSTEAGGQCSVTGGNFNNGGTNWLDGTTSPNTLTFDTSGAYEGTSAHLKRSSASTSYYSTLYQAVSIKAATTYVLSFRYRTSGQTTVSVYVNGSNTGSGTANLQSGSWALVTTTVTKGASSTPQLALGAYGGVGDAYFDDIKLYPSP